uniref:RRM domain-containing protein n=1 Tax=Gouania willdenowi TaxID=441366 RepID=A0A8C5H7I7_GOUWI
MALIRTVIESDDRVSTLVSGLKSSSGFCISDDLHRSQTVDVKNPKTALRKHPNFGFVVFNNSEPVQKILSSRPIELFDNVRLNVQEKKTRSPREVEGRESEGRRMVRYPDAHQLFVGNIPHDVEKPELMEFFEQFGSVLDFKIICREKHPNFGFVVFNDSEPVQKILSSRPIELFDNVRLNVQKKKTCSPREVERGDARPRGGTNKPSLGSGHYPACFRCFPLPTHLIEMNRIVIRLLQSLMMS